MKSARTQTGPYMRSSPRKPPPGSASHQELQYLFSPTRKTSELSGALEGHLIPMAIPLGMEKKKERLNLREPPSLRKKSLLPHRKLFFLVCPCRGSHGIFLDAVARQLMIWGRLHVPNYILSPRMYSCVCLIILMRKKILQMRGAEDLLEK